MAEKFAGIVAKKLFKEDLTNRFGQEDPYFERVPATRLDGRPSKKGKKRKKAAPPGISEHDVRVLTQVKRRAYRLDMSLFNCCGIRFGWSSLIGIIPGVGDVFDCMMALMVVRTCRKVEGGLPNSLQQKMMFNIIVDFVVGLIPILGDLADAVYKCNTRNAILLEHYLRAKGESALKKQGLAVTEDPSLPVHFDKQLTNESDESLPRHNQDVALRTNEPAPVARIGASDHIGHGRTAPSATANTPKKSRWSFGGGSTTAQPHPADIEQPAVTPAVAPSTVPGRTSSKLRKGLPGA